VNHLKRNILTALLCVCLLAGLTACGGDGGLSNISLVSEYTRDLEGTTLNVYNWGKYIAEDNKFFHTCNAFQALTGIKVYYTNFTTNEELYAVLAGGGVHYDVIFPSDYLIQRLIEEDRLQPLDYTNIPNYSYILEEYRDLYYDPGNVYSIPYTCGTMGLIYNMDMVETVPDSWAALWDPQYKGQILQFASPRDAFGTAQFLLGQDVNSLDEADWRAAADKLKEQATLLQAYVADEIYNIMQGGNAAVAPYYVGDYVDMLEDTEVPLGFVYPKEGINFFYDAMCIPSDAQNVEAAQRFINFLLEPDVALANAEVTRYATPHAAVRANPKYTLQGNPYLYRDPSQLPPIQYYKHLPRETLTLLNNLWTEVKQS
jgi:spermidine/putrescine transport system substrate-binding protein